MQGPDKPWCGSGCQRFQEAVQAMQPGLAAELHQLLQFQETNVVSLDKGLKLCQAWEISFEELAGPLGCWHALALTGLGVSKQACSQKSLKETSSCCCDLAHAHG